MPFHRLLPRPAKAHTPSRPTLPADPGHADAFRTVKLTGVAKDEQSRLSCSVLPVTRRCGLEAGLGEVASSCPGPALSARDPLERADTVTLPAPGNTVWSR